MRDLDWFKTLFTFIQRWALNGSVRGSYGDIRLGDMTFTAQHSADFVAQTTQALQLIERVDPRHFYYVRSELRCIVNEPLLYGGMYRKKTHSCSIDFLRYRCDPNLPEYEWHLATYASTLVHEATHGRIHRFGIPYNNKTWMRVERLCRLEQKRFASRLHSETYDFRMLVPDFDPAEWQAIRKLSLIQRARKLIVRSREIDRADQN